MHSPLGDWMKTVDWRMIRKGPWKYVWHNGMDDEVFNLAPDPGEVVNLAGRHEVAETQAELRSELGAFLARTGDPLEAAFHG